MQTHRDILAPELKNVLKEFGDLKGRTVLEIGHGQDREIRGILEDAGLIYFGTDIYNGDSNDGKTRQKGEEYFHFPMEDLSGFEEGQFDIVIAVHAFEHTEQPVKSLREMKRILIPQGKLVLITPYPCKHQILEADRDHINVLNEMQLLRLMTYTQFSSAACSVQRIWTIKEQDWNVFTMGKK